MARALVLLAQALAVAPAAHADPSQIAFIKGLALGLYDDGDKRPALAEIAGVGADHVSLVVSWRQHDVTSVALAPVPGTTVTDERLRGLVRAAHHAGLKVFIFPIIEVEVRKLGEWRGTLRPDDAGAWWDSYEGFILHYAALAGDEHAELFAVGSELVSTESWRDRWYHLISAVRRRFSGKLVYSANWDHYLPVSFWDRVDYLGVTAYFELTTRDDATADELERGWRKVRVDLTAFAARVGRPLLITEVGCPSQNGAAVHPWDYTRTAPVDLEEQRRAYSAFVAAWNGEPRLAGVFFWDWSGAGGPRDGGYTPRGKPAEKVLRSWYTGMPQPDMRN